MRRSLALTLQRSAPLVDSDAEDERIARMRDLNCRCLRPQEERVVVNCLGISAEAKQKGRTATQS